MSDEDINTLAHRIVQEATDGDEFLCPNGHPMEKRESRRETGNSFGGNRIVVMDAYFVCPVCGHDTRQH